LNSSVVLALHSGECRRLLPPVLGARAPEVIDLVNASAVLEESLILVSASPANYKSYEKYGVAVISVQDPVSILDKV